MAYLGRWLTLLRSTGCRGSTGRRAQGWSSTALYGCRGCSTNGQTSSQGFRGGRSPTVARDSFFDFSGSRGASSFTGKPGRLDGFNQGGTTTVPNLCRSKTNRRLDSLSYHSGTRSDGQAREHGGD